MPGVLLELRAQGREYLALAGLAGDREAPQERPTDQDSARPERECPDDIRSPPDAAVNQDLDPPVDRLGDLRQHLRRRNRTIERPAAVIRDDDGLRSGIDGEPGVVRVEDALEHERHREASLESIDERPVELVQAD